MAIELKSLDQKVFTTSAMPVDSMCDIAGGIAVFAFGNSTRAMGLRPLIKGDQIRCVAVHDGPRPEGAELASVQEFNCDVVSIDQAVRAIKEAVHGSSSSAPFPVFVDVSCLARPIIGQLFAMIAQIAWQRVIKLYVGYQLAKFSAPPEKWAHAIRRIEPIHPMFSGWTGSALMPLNVVVGLGYERGKAQGALEYLEPAKRYVLIPESPQTEYLHEVRMQNELLLGEAACSRARYQVMDPVGTFGTLLSLTSGFKDRCRGLLLPFGPKIFLAISLLIAMTNDEIAVWHVDGENNEPNLKSEPTENAVLFWCELGPSRPDLNVRSNQSS